MVEDVLPPDIFLVHYLDDFVLMHHDKGHLRSNTGNTVDSLGREGLIVSPKSVSEPAIQFVFLGKWVDLLERMVWSHAVALLQMLVAWPLVGGMAVAKQAYAIIFRVPSLVGAATRRGVPFCCRGLFLDHRGTSLAYSSSNPAVPCCSTAQGC